MYLHISKKQLQILTVGGYICKPDYTLLSVVFMYETKVILRIYSQMSYYILCFKKPKNLLRTLASTTKIKVGNVKKNNRL